MGLMGLVDPVGTAEQPLHACDTGLRRAPPIDSLGRFRLE